MEHFKKTIYDNYISNHNKSLYGVMTLDKINAYYPVVQYFYLRHLPQNKAIRVLDLGCGDGNLVYCLNKAGYPNAHGVDISKEQIEKGIELGIQNLKQADIKEYLASNTEPFDAIIAKDVIEHFTREEAFELVGLVNKNLKPEGLFLMQVPNGEGIFYTSVFYGDYTHEMAYTQSSVRQVALNTGYRRSECFPTGPVPYTVIGRLRKLIWSLKVAQLRFWKRIETGNPNGIFTQNLIAVLYK